jgi:sugar phosphate isomerase/epimerase
MTKPIGVQLYSLRTELAQDFAGTIQELAQIGYPVLEGYNGMPLGHAAIARLIKSHGLQMPSCHLPLPFGENERMVKQAIEQYDLQYAVLPWMSPDLFQTIDDVKRVCAQLNQARLLLESYGVSLGYHNHEFEFALVEGRSAYEIMLAELDPGIVLEVDVYWAQTAGQDPIALVRRLGKRAPLLHLKDGPANIAVRDAPMVPLGEGNVDVSGVVAAAGENADFLVVELDSCATDMMTAIRQSYHYLTRKGLAHGNQ